MNLYYVAAFAKNSNAGWFSLGRMRKVDQVKSMLTSLGLQITCLNIAPQEADVSFPDTLSLCQSSFVPIRFLQIFISSVRFFCFSTQRHVPSILWLYNTRAAESVVAIICLFLRPSIRLVLQLEDLPSARQENHNFAGWIDGLFNSFLTNRASLVFAVSLNVAKEYSHLTRSQLSQINFLPPALHPDYLKIINSRLDPFSSIQTSILYAGSYQSDKGVLDLIKAFLELEPGSFKLYLVGSSPASLKNEYSHCRDIIFTGVVSDNDLFRLYSRADIIVNPHRHILNPTYVFPFKLVEIVSSGALPLSTPVPGVEIFSLPHDCLFSCVDQLKHKLTHSYSVWKANRNRLEEIARQCRVDYSYHVIQAELNKAMAKLHNSST